jgi:cyclic pyranopterin phosphate synthase
MSKLSHIGEDGAARMVDVSAKPVTDREASAEAIVVLSPEAFAAARTGDNPKGDILSTARIAGIQAAKNTAELIPLCHSLPLAAVHVEFEWLEGQNALRIVTRARTSAQTGVEMEALTAAAVAALTVYDMVKAIDRAALIRSIRLVSKSGGKSGTYVATL